MSTLRRVLVSLPLLFVLGCGGGDDSTGPSTDPTVSLTAPQEGAQVTGTFDLIASASNADEVIFLVDGAEVGRDTASPYIVSWNSATVANGGRVVTARAIHADKTAEDTASIVVNNAGGGVAVVVTPPAATVRVGLTQQFAASVTGTANTAVTWTVLEGAANGTISADGLYAAPNLAPAPASATIRATSVADPTKSDTAVVTIESPGGGEVTISVTPATANLGLGQTQQFTATVGGTNNTSVTWEVLGGASFGAVSASGLYTAPAVLPNPASATVRATSVADASKNASATVTLTGTGSGLPADQELAVRAAYGVGLPTTQTSADAVHNVAFLVFTASGLNGNRLTTTGTLTQTQSDFTYAATPTDRLVVLLTSGVRIEITVTAFTGDTSDSFETFRDYHTDLRFHYVIQNVADLTVVSTSGTPGIPGTRGVTTASFVRALPPPEALLERTPEDNPQALVSRDFALEQVRAARLADRLAVTPAARRTNLRYTRQLSGSVTLPNLGTYQLALNVAGDYFFSLDSGFAENERDETCQGTVNGQGLAVTTNDRFYSHYLFNSGDGIGVGNYINRGGSNATIGGVAFRFQDLLVKYELTNGKVGEPDYWEASGALFRQTEQIGVVRFDGVPIPGTAGPSVILDLGQNRILRF